MSRISAISQRLCFAPSESVPRIRRFIRQARNVRVKLTPELTEYVIKRARFKAKRLAKQMPSLGDYEDIQQDLILDVLERLPKYNGKRAAEKTFISRLISHKIADIIETNRCAGDLNGISCDECITDECGNRVRRSSLIDENLAHAHVGLAPRRGLDQRSLEIDTAQVINKLSPLHQKICMKLQRQGPTDVARECGIARSSIYTHIAMIREFFVRAELQLYL